MKKHKSITLFSGGLDSLVCVKHMQSKGYETIPIFFETAFFKADTARYFAEKNNIDLEICDITNIHMEMTRKPQYGYGKFFNPCIDCHALMFEEAGKRLNDYGADYLISGEVLGQRPMSQRKDSLNSVSNLSGYKDLIIRPLSQKLLKPTKPIRQKWVDLADMLDIQGRSRRRQMQLADKFEIKEYPSSAGGCRLTEEVFSNRLYDLVKHDEYNLRNIEILNYGRQFRLYSKIKFVLGRDKEENEKLTDWAENEIVIKMKEKPGPLGIFISKETVPLEMIELGGQILLNFAPKANKNEDLEFGKKFQLNRTITTDKINKKQLKKYWVG